MKERPIIFTGSNVRAILEGRKTQTRRIVKFHKPYPSHDSWHFAYRHKDGGWVWTDSEFKGALLQDVTSRKAGKLCPDGQPGDSLWVRETWLPKYGKLSRGTGVQGIDYRADYANPGPGWRSPIHLPRWASRIMLEILNVRVERVEEISEEDCAAEGIQIPVEQIQEPPVCGLLRVSGKYPPSDYMDSSPKPTTKEHQWLRAHFASLWDSINAKRGFGWEANPWVWVIEFKVVR